MDHDQWLAQHDRMMSDHAMMLAEHKQTMTRIDRRLDRAVRLAVPDARSQRKRNAEFDEKMTQIAAAQLQNEELLRAFLERGENGKH
ncbi:MAG TPA: hypothetical protein VNY05_24730 [Candidatus Acidoferrales bacterium]|jgi:hypothetical protein|nr:hypothetical protein [Candidatus Acidoferrales bacterium]